MDDAHLPVCRGSWCPPLPVVAHIQRVWPGFASCETTDRHAAGSGPVRPPLQPQAATAVPGDSLIAAVKPPGSRHRRAHGSLRGRGHRHSMALDGWSGAMWCPPCSRWKTGRHFRERPRSGLRPGGTNWGGRNAPIFYAATACGLDRNTVPSIHMRWRMRAILSATATFAFLKPVRLAIFSPQSRRADAREILVSNTLAAS